MFTMLIKLPNAAETRSLCVCSVYVSERERERMCVCKILNVPLALATNKTSERNTRIIFFVLSFEGSVEIEKLETSTFF